jgi:FAD synthase
MDCIEVELFYFSFFIAGKMRAYQPVQPRLHIKGRVDHGFGRGSSELGYPTANINSISSESLLSFLNDRSCRDGIYIGWCSRSSDCHPRKAAISVGVNPSFEDSRTRLLEAHILDYNGPKFYGEELRVVITGFIRESVKFSDIGELRATIERDCAFAREWLDKHVKLDVSDSSFLSFQD